MGTKNNTSTLFILIRKWKLLGHDIRMQNARVCTTALTWHPDFVYYEQITHGRSFKKE